MAISLNVFVLLGLLEVLIILGVLGAAVTFKWRAAQRKTEALSMELHKAKSEVKNQVEKTAVERNGNTSEPLPVYTDFLREQLEQSSILLGEDPLIQTDQDAENPADVTRQMLAARHQFLQLELDVQSLSAERDVEAQRRSVVDGMQALLAGLVVHPDAAKAQSETDAAVEDMAAEAPVSTSLSEEQKLRGQVDFLRNVVSNQHDVMHELRQLLEDQGGDSDELQAVMRKLGDAEKQGSELQRHLDEMEKENNRFKRAVRENGGKQVDAAGPDSDMLRDLVGNQQRTIGNLQNLLRNLPSDSGKTKELDDVINKIQRTNNDLSSCVMVLEDENDHLREKVESLQKRIADLESSVDAVPEAVAIPASIVDAATTDIPTDAAPAQGVNTDADESDADALPATSAPIAESAAIDLADGKDDVDARLDAAAADIETKPAVSEPVADDIAEDVDPAQDISADTDDFDVDALLDASAPEEKQQSIGLADSVDDIDALLDAAAANNKTKTAVSEPKAAAEEVENPATVDLAQDVSPDTDDVDALLDTSAPVAKPAAIDLADSNDDIDGLLDAAAAESKEETAVSEPVTDTDAVEKPAAVDLAQDISADADGFDVDALLAASAPGNDNAAKQAEPVPNTAKPPSPTQGAAEQDDIDALLADLFADDNKTDGGSKS